MTKIEVKKFRQILEARQSELTRVLRNREGIAIEKSPDSLDEVQQAAERELAIRNLDRESWELRQVGLAIQRLEEGTYGTCVNCEEDINPKRLAAMSWAQYCIGCQEQADRGEMANERISTVGYTHGDCHATA